MIDPAHDRLDDLVLAAGREPAPDRTAALLAAIDDADLAPGVATGRRRSLERRRALGLIGVVQLMVAIPVLFGLDIAVHSAREVASWQVALGAGFLFAAWRPVRAIGLAPVVGIVALVTVTTAIIDVAGGSVSLASEWSHIVEILGFLLVRGVAADADRALPKSSPRSTATHA